MCLPSSLPSFHVIPSFVNSGSAYLLKNYQYLTQVQKQ